MHRVCEGLQWSFYGVDCLAYAGIRDNKIQRHWWRSTEEESAPDDSERRHSNRL